jgi:hypothetical protein
MLCFGVVIVVDFSYANPRSNNIFIQTHSATAFDSAIYFDLVFDKTTNFCFLLDQLTTLPSNMKQHPNVDFQVSMSLAQSTSKNPNKIFPSLHFLHFMPICKVPFMYPSTIFKVC